MKTMRNGVLLALALGLFACGNKDSQSGDDYADAVPDGSMLGLGTSSSESGLTNAADDLKKLADDTRKGLDQLLSDTHDGLLQVAMSATPVEITKGKTTCKVWEVDSQGTHWQLVSCQLDARARHYLYVLQGRPSASSSDADYKPVFAGYGKVLPRVLGGRRGSGVIGWDFDAYAKLTGASLGGKMAIGYRAAGRAHQLLIGLDKLEGEGNPGNPWTALFRYTDIVGLGGKFVFLTPAADVLTRTDGQLQTGQDGVDEAVRAALAWNAAGGARTVFTACGGTVGSNTCVSVAQCWTVTGAEAGKAQMGESPTFDERACPAVAFDLAAPDEASTKPPPGSSDANGAPGVTEPGPVPGE